MRRHRRPKLGDILEFRTSAGLAYLQYVLQHPEFGALIRVMPRTFDVRPASFESLLQERERFVIFFPLQEAVRRRIVAIVGEADVPEHLRTAPLFRAAGHRDQETGTVTDWWLWDGVREWHVGALSAEQRRLPLRAIWNDTLLAERIVSGWMPEEE